jgi:hypothetical protein
LVLFGFGLGGRFLYFYVQEPDVSGHMQSLQVGVGAVVLGFVVGLMAFFGDLLAANRRLNEEILGRIRRLDAELAADKRRRGGAIDGVLSTGAEPW